MLTARIRVGGTLSVSALRIRVVCGCVSQAPLSPYIGEESERDREQEARGRERGEHGNRIPSSKLSLNLNRLKLLVLEFKVKAAKITSISKKESRVVN